MSKNIEVKKWLALVFLLILFFYLSITTFLCNIVGFVFHRKEKQRDKVIFPRSYGNFISERRY